MKLALVVAMVAGMVRLWHLAPSLPDYKADHAEMCIHTRLSGPELCQLLKVPVKPHPIYECFAVYPGNCSLQEETCLVNACLPIPKELQ